MRPDAQQLALAIKEKLGIDMTDNLDGLLRKMNARLQELNLSVWEYLQYIRLHTSEWERIIDLVTINETYFFREEEQLDELKKIIQNLEKKHVRVWSAACSTGEEPYTLAMILSEHLPSDVSFEIVASDINQDVIAFAKRATYSKNSLSFRRLEKEKIARYFDEAGEDYCVKEIYKEKVTFQPFNLVDSNAWFYMRNFDIIFCRNVLIYFDEEAVKQVVEGFYDALDKKGYLFLGHSDPYRQIHPDFTFVRTPKTLYLTKGGN